MSLLLPLYHSGETKNFNYSEKKSCRVKGIIFWFSLGFSIHNIKATFTLNIPIFWHFKTPAHVWHSMHACFLSPMELFLNDVASSSRGSHETTVTVEDFEQFTFEEYYSGNLKLPLYCIGKCTKSKYLQKEPS